MIIESQVELIKFFMMFLWILNCVIAGLLFVCLGVIAHLCYKEMRDSKYSRTRRSNR